MQTDYSVWHIFGGEKNDASLYTDVIDHLSIVFCCLCTAVCSIMHDSTCKSHYMSQSKCKNVVTDCSTLNYSHDLTRSCLYYYAFGKKNRWRKAECLYELSMRWDVQWTVHTNTHWRQEKRIGKGEVNTTALITMPTKEGMKYTMLWLSLSLLNVFLTFFSSI